jgi:hypothetical protein
VGHPQVHWKDAAAAKRKNKDNAEAQSSQRKRRSVRVKEYKSLRDWGVAHRVVDGWRKAGEKKERVKITQRRRVRRGSAEIREEKRSCGVGA